MTTVDLNAVYERVVERKRQATERYGVNKVAILRAMKAHGIPKLQVTYSGAGDSGCVEGVDALDVGKENVPNLDAIKVPMATVSSRFADGQWIDEVKRKRVSLREAAETFAYDWLEAKHPGWENNDGADGEIVFDREDGKVFLTHNSHYTETDTEEEEL